jgi:hypothetical protein
LFVQLTLSPGFTGRLDGLAPLAESEIDDFVTETTTLTVPEPPGLHE